MSHSVHQSYIFPHHDSDRDKYSRYNPESLCSQINQSNGKPITIDDETFALLNFADTCYQLSDGVFDLTSGVLRKVWRFDCSDNIPSIKSIAKTMENVGWQKVEYDDKKIILPKDMEIDFGGIGKEYAVDRSILLINALTKQPVLVNLGGDLATNAARKNGEPWQVGVEHPGFVDKKTMVVSLFKGALATSGDAKRFLQKNGKRYSHILNAITGWPIFNPYKQIKPLFNLLNKGLYNLYNNYSLKRITHLCNNCIYTFI